MRHSRFTPGLGGAVLLIVSLLASGSLAPTPAAAAEDVDGFLQALYQRYYFDTALEYLEMIKDSPLVDAETKSSLPFLYARTEYFQGAVIPDERQEEKEAQFLKAIKSFKAFAAANPEHPRAIDSLFEVAGVYQSMAKTRLALVGGEADSQRGEARDLLGQARKALADVAGKVTKRQAELLKNPASVTGDISVVRERLNNILVRAEYQQAEIEQELASTYAKGSGPYRDQLTKAAELYEEFFDKHFDLVIGLRAIVRAGQCYRDIGNVDFALSCFESILNDDELKKAKQLRGLLLEAIRAAMVLWSKQVDEAKTYRLAQPIYERAMRSSDLKLSEEDLKSPEGLAVAYLRASLSVKMADKMEKIKLKQVQQQREDIVELATASAKLVAENEGEFQPQAAVLYRKLTGEEIGIATEEPETFSEALRQAQILYQQWAVTHAALDEATGAEREKVEAEAAEQLARSEELLRLALSMAQPDTKSADVGDAYSRLTIVYWFGQRYEEAAVVGEHLARRYPNVYGASSAGDIAIKAWAKLLAAAQQRGEDGKFERQQIESLARYISKQWKGSEEAGDALYRLITFAVADDDLDTALDYLQQMPSGASRRPSAQLMLGPRLWRRYRESRQSLEEDARTALIDQCEQLLREGLEASLAGGSVNPTFGFPALYLAQVYVENDEPQKSIAWLQHDQIGPLTLLEAGNERFSQNQALVTSVYRTALQTYVKLLSTLEDDEFAKTKDTVVAMMEKLEQSSKKKSTVAATYTNLGKEIEADIRRRRDSGDDEGAARLSEAFETILFRIADQSGSTYGSLLWVGQTLQSFGEVAESILENLPTGPAADKQREKAELYYGKAVVAFEQIMKRKREFKLQDNSLTALKIALAECQLGADKSGDALVTIREVLQTHHSYPNAQRLAALALQADGQYKEAILGDGDPPPGAQANTKLIMGWKRLASVISSYMGRKPNDARYRNLYFEAHLGNLNCLVALAKAGNQKLFGVAKRTLDNFEKQHPDLGGEKWKPKFEAVRAQLP